MPERIPFSLGSIAAANILDDEHITARHDLEGRHGCPVHALVVGRAHQDDRKFVYRFGPVDVRIKGDTIASLHGYTVLDEDVGRGSNGSGLRLKHWYGKHETRENSKEQHQAQDGMADSHPRNLLQIDFPERGIRDEHRSDSEGRIGLL